MKKVLSLCLAVLLSLSAALPVTAAHPADYSAAIGRDSYGITQKKDDDEELVTVYAPDGRSKKVKKSQVAAEVSVGWYTVPVTYMYALDGRWKVVPIKDVAANQAVGWYLRDDYEAAKNAQPKVTLFATDGRIIQVEESNVAAQIAVGWSRTPPNHTVTDFGGTRFETYWEYANGTIIFTPTELGAFGASVYLGWLDISAQSKIKTMFIKRGFGHFTPANCDYPELTRVEIPDTVKEFPTIPAFTYPGYNGGVYFGTAFQDCPLTRIGIPASVESGIIKTSPYEATHANEMPIPKSATIYCEEGSYAMQFAKENGYSYVPATIIYHPDGRTMMVSAEERPVYLANGWLSSPGTTLYASDGRTKMVSEDQIEANRLVGWMTIADYIIFKANEIAEAKGYNEAFSFLYYFISSSGPFHDTITQKMKELYQTWRLKNGNVPVAIEGYTIEKNSIGIPEVRLDVFNLTDKTIQRIDVTWTCLDAYGNPTSDNYNSNGIFEGYSDLKMPPYDGSRSPKWTMNGHQQTTSITNCSVIGVAFTDGTSWRR